MPNQHQFYRLILLVLLPAGLLAQTIETDRIPGGMRGPYCLNELLRGERSFAGVPMFEAEVNVMISPDRQRVTLKTVLNAQERGEDHSQGRGQYSEILWRAPVGATIRAVRVNRNGRLVEGNRFYSRWLNFNPGAENQPLPPPPSAHRITLSPGDVTANIGYDIAYPNMNCGDMPNIRFELYPFEVEYEMPALAPALPPPAKKQPDGSGSTSPPTKASPVAVATGSINKKAVAITYGQPLVRGRDVWRSISPYGKIWRTGANEATTIRFSRDVVIEGKSLEAGTYAFFTIPGPERWTLIFNRTADQWGALKYDPAEDALRVEVNSSPHIFTEQLTFLVRSDGVLLFWADTEVFFRVD